MPKPKTAQWIEFDEDPAIERKRHIAKLRALDTDDATRVHIDGFIALSHAMSSEQEKRPRVEVDGDEYGLVPHTAPSVVKWLQAAEGIDQRATGLLLAVYVSAQYENNILNGARPKMSWHSTLEKYLSQYRACLAPKSRATYKAFLTTSVQSKAAVRTRAQNNAQTHINDPLCCHPGPLQEMLWRLILSPNWQDVFIGLAFATGRRLETIHSSLKVAAAKSRVDDEKHGDRYWAKLTDMVKQRSTKNTLYIPLLLPTETVIKKLAWVRDQVGNKTTNAVGIAVRARLKELLGSGRSFKLHWARAVYAKLAHVLSWVHINQDATLSIRDLLGHRANSSLDSYATVKLLPSVSDNRIHVHRFRGEADEDAWIGRVFKGAGDLPVDFQACWGGCRASAVVYE